MLQSLRDHRFFTSYMLLLVAGIVWIGLVSGSCTLAEGQAKEAVHCCCDEVGTDTGCGAPSVVSSADAHCTVLQAGDCFPDQPALVVERLQALPALERYHVSVDSPPSDSRIAYRFLPTSRSPQSHPAQRFRVLLI